MPLEVIDRVNAIGMSQDQPKLLTFYDRKGELIGDMVELPPEVVELHDTEFEPPADAISVDDDTMPDDSLEPPIELQQHEPHQDIQLDDLLQEPPLDASAMMPHEPPLDPVILNEGVDDDPELRRSTRTRVQSSSYIPSEEIQGCSSIACSV